MPDWFGPPDNILPGDVGRSLVIARNSGAIVWLHGVVAYPQGLSFRLLIRTRVRDEFDPFDPLGGPFHFMHPGRRENADDVFRFGVEFADGRRVTTLDGAAFELGADPERPPDRPVLVPGGGGGGAGSWDMEHWLWPLPPAGSVTFACAWPARGIPLTKTEFDGAIFADAASRAETLWEPTGPAFGRSIGGFSSYRGLASSSPPMKPEEPDT